MSWVIEYLASGLFVFALMIYIPVSERPPSGWWHDRSYLLASLVLVAFWPAAVMVWLSRRR